MPFEDNSFSQKWHMTKTPPEIGKYDTHKKWYPTKMAHLVNKIPKGYLVFYKD